MFRWPLGLSADFNIVIYEDELPEDISEEAYELWFSLSWVDGVRMGPLITEVDKDV